MGCTVSGSLSGKNVATRSSSASLPSSTRQPIAMATKLLVTEYIRCGRSAAKGAQ